MNNRLSVIVPVYNGEKYLENTLECLVTQTVENFEVIIVDDGSTDSTPDIAQKYCDEYNDFYYIRQEHKGIYAARNAGIDKAKCEYLMFLDCGNILTDGSVEAIFAVADEQDADMITGRNWRHGDIEYEYEKSLDVLATQPQVEMLESRLLYSETLGAKAIRKKLFDLYNIRFLDLTAHAELLFIMQCVFKGIKISGCPDFIHEESVLHIQDGWSQTQLPTAENVRSAKYVFSEIFETARDIITEQTGTCDGDEAYIQEIIYMIYRFYLDNFYRRYWYMDEDGLNEMKGEFEKYAQFVKADRFKKLQEHNGDIRLPYIYVDKKEAADEPEFTIFFDLAKEDEYLPFLRSLYSQTFPFFEVIISESRFSSEAFPEEFRKMENLVVLPDKGFHTAARTAAKSGICLEIRSGEPLDMRVLRETAETKVPKFMKQYIFASKRKTLTAKKVLKDKGLNFND